MDKRLKSVSLTSRTIFWLILVGFIVIGLYAFFSSRIGQTALLVCCGGLIALAVAGILSERGCAGRGKGGRELCYD
jgi:hypothetical protein